VDLLIAAPAFWALSSDSYTEEIRHSSIFRGTSPEAPVQRSELYQLVVVAKVRQIP
jgi:hypothetical protein